MKSLVSRKYSVMLSNARLVRWQFPKLKVATRWCVRTVGSISATSVTRRLMDMIISSMKFTTCLKLINYACFVYIFVFTVFIWTYNFYSFKGWEVRSVPTRSYSGVDRAHKSSPSVGSDSS